MFFESFLSGREKKNVERKIQNCDGERSKRRNEKKKIVTNWRLSSLLTFSYIFLDVIIEVNGSEEFFNILI